jgi:hypothetical protein
VPRDGCVEGVSFTSTQTLVPSSSSQSLHTQPPPQHNDFIWSRALVLQVLNHEDIPYVQLVAERTEGFWRILRLIQLDFKALNRSCAKQLEDRIGMPAYMVAKSISPGPALQIFQAQETLSDAGLSEEQCMALLNWETVRIWSPWISL